MMSEVQSFHALGGDILKKEISDKTHLSPRVSSPLTPPATGEAKLDQTDNGSSTSNISNGRVLPKDLSRSPTTTSPNQPKHHIHQTFFPVRDSPKNPFLQGGPADAGLSGPRKWYAKQRIANIPKREPGKMTYVFRGQRVTYAEPFASDESDEDEPSSTTITSTYLGDGRWRHERVPADRLRPKILFPTATFTPSSSSSNQAQSKKRSAKASSSTFPSSPRKSNLFEDLTNYKRQKIDTVNIHNQDLLKQLEKSSWGSDDEEEEEIEKDKLEEEEVNISMLSDETIQQEDVCQYSAEITKSSEHFDESDDGISEDEEDEVEENPFLDIASSSATTRQQYEYHAKPPNNRPQTNTDSNLFNTFNASSHNQYSTSASQASNIYRHPFAHRPRGHAHSLAHSMHVPGHLKGRRI